FPSPALFRSDVNRLSDRELEIFSFIGTGLSVSELASELNVSVKTIETNQMRLKENLGVVSAQKLCKKQISTAKARGPEEQYFRWIHLAVRQRAIPSDAPHKNHTVETRHFAGPTRDVGSAGRCESFAAGPRKCGGLGR